MSKKDSRSTCGTFSFLLLSRLLQGVSQRLGALVSTEREEKEACFIKALIYFLILGTDDNARLVKRWDSPGCGTKKEPHSCWAWCHERSGLPYAAHDITLPRAWCYLNSGEYGDPDICASNGDCEKLMELYNECRPKRYAGGGCAGW